MRLLLFLLLTIGIVLSFVLEKLLDVLGEKE